MFGTIGTPIYIKLHMCAQVKYIKVFEKNVYQCVLRNFDFERRWFKDVY